MKEKVSLVKNYMYNLFFQVFSLLAPLVTTPYISRVLDAESIGEYSYTLAVAKYFGIIGILGANTYGQLQISKNRGDDRERSRIFLEIFLSKSVTMCIVTFLYGIVILFSKLHRQMYIILFIYLITQIFDITWFFQGLEKFEVIIVRNTIIKILTIISIFCFVKHRDDVYLYVGILHGGILLSNLSLWTLIREYIIITPMTSKFIARNIKSNMVYFIPSIASIVFTSLDKCMLGWRTSSTLENGYYEQAYKIYTILVTIATSLSVVVLPRMSYLWQEIREDTGQIRALVERTFRLTCVTVFPIAVGVFTVIPVFVPLFFGEGYEKCVILIRIFCLLVILTSFNNIISHQCLVASGRQKILNKFLLISSIVNFLCNIVFIYFLQSVGAVIASVISEMVLLILIISYCRDIFSISFFLRNSFRYFFYSLLMGSGILVFDRLINLSSSYKILMEIVLGIFIYMLCLIVAEDAIYLAIKAYIKNRLKTKN